MRRSLLIAMAVALLFGALALGGGFLFDDWPMRALVEQRVPGAHHPLDAYRFVGGPVALRDLTERGPFPWFCAPDLRLGSFRPLSAALLLLDERLFGDRAVGWHAHALLWYLALVAAAALVLARVLRGPTLTVALVLFAASDTHAQALGWLSNRHSTIAVTLALLGLFAHMRAREDGWRPGRVLSPALLALALLAGETAIGVLAYLLAWELLGRTDDPRRRVHALAPAMLLTAVYLVAYKLGGYGAHHTDGYLDPIDAPLAYALVAPVRLLSLIGAFFLGPPADLQLQVHGLDWLWPLLGVAAIAVVSALARRAWPALDDGERRGLRWLLTGAVLAFAPSLGATVGGRLLIVPSLGGAAVCAVLLVSAWRARAGVARKLLFGALVFFFAVRPALILAASLAKFREYSQALVRVARESELPSSPEVAVVVPLAPDFIVGTYTPTVRAVDGGELPRAWWALSLARHDHVLVRTAADRIELTSAGPMLRARFETLYRSRALPLHPGDTVQLKGMTVRVLEVDDGSPTKIAAEFDRSLDDPTLWLVEWRDGLLRRMKVPAIGETVKLEWRKGPFGL